MAVGLMCNRLGKKKREELQRKAEAASSDPTVQAVRTCKEWIQKRLVSGKGGSFEDSVYDQICKKDYQKAAELIKNDPRP